MRMLRAVITVVLLAGMTLAQNPAGKHSSSRAGKIPSFDAAALDKSADPCVDFYEFSCGGWMKKNPVPSDQPIWGRFSELAERNRLILRGILEKAAAQTAGRTPNEQKIGDYYASCMDEAAINKKGVAVLKPEFERIDAVKDRNGLPALVAHLHGEGVNVLFAFGSGADFKPAGPGSTYTRPANTASTAWFPTCLSSRSHGAARQASPWSGRTRVECGESHSV